MADAIAKLIGGMSLVLAVFLVLALIIGFPVMWMWNYVVPDVFGLPPIHFWQAFWLTVLCNIMFSGLGFSSGSD